MSRFLSSLCLLVLLCTLAPGQTVPPNTPQPAARIDRSGDPLPAGAVARLGTTRFRHYGPVSFVGYSADGALLLTAGTDALRVWEARTGKEVRKLALKQSNMRRMVFSTGPSVLLSADGRTLVLGADDGDCSVVNVASGKVVREFQVNQAAQAQFGFTGNGSQSVLSPDGRHLVVMESDRFGAGVSKLSVWDTGAGKLVRQLSPKKKGESFTAATISPDGKTLVAVEGANANGGKGNAAAAKPQFTLWDIATGQEVRSMASPLAAVSELKSTADGKSLLARDGGPSVRLLDAGTLKEVRQYSAKQGNARGMLLSPDQKSLFVAGAGQVVQYDVQTGKELRAFPVPAGPDLEQFLGPFQRLSQFSMAVSPDGATLVVPSLSTMAFWDLRTGKEIQTWQGHRDRIESVAFAPGGKEVLTGSADSGLYLWDAGTGERRREFILKAPVAAANNFPGREQMNLFQVRAVFTPDGKGVAGLRWGDRLYVWDAAGGKPPRQLGAAKAYTAFAFSADGRNLALAGPDGMELWDPVAGKQRRSFGSARPANPQQFAGMEQQVCSAAFSPDGRLLACAVFKVEMGDASMKTYVDYLELASGQKRVHFETRTDITTGMSVDFGSIMSALDSFVAAFVFAPDGNMVAEAGFSSIKLRSLHSGKEIRAFGGKQVAAGTAVFSPDGTMLLAGKQDGAVRLWDVATGSVLLDFPAHQGPVTALAFSADGKLLATAAKDASAVVWDWDYVRRQATTSEPKATALAHERLWADLASDDAPRAFAAISALVAAPGETVTFLKGRLRPVPSADARHVQGLVADLDHKQFVVRKKAEQALEKLGDLAASAIKDQLTRSPSLEMTRRLEGLAKKLDAQVATAEVLQALRAVEVLERIGSPDAREVLDRLARGAPGHRVTEQARLSLQWLGKRKARVSVP